MVAGAEEGASDTVPDYSNGSRYKITDKRLQHNETVPLTWH
jgi:hypothetical protein